METLIEGLRRPEYQYLYTREFKDFIEMHLADLREASSTNEYEMTVSDVDKSRAHRNFNVLCSIMKIPPQLHWLTLRVNNYREYNEFHSTHGPLYFVNTNMLDQLKLAFRESQTIT